MKGESLSKVEFTLEDFEYCVDPNRQLTVKLHVSDSITLTQARCASDTIKDIKQNLRLVFNINDIQIRSHKGVLPDNTTINSIPINAYDIVELDLISEDVDKVVARIQDKKDFVVPDILTVKVEDGDESRDVVVEVENRAIDKPQLGGYKNIKTGVSYFHGYTQTGPPPPKVPPENKTNRDTQTYEVRNRTNDQPYSRAIQVPRNDLYIPSITDRILTPGPYELAEDYEKRLNLEAKVMFIQRCFRSWRLHTYLKELSEEYEKRKQLEEEQEAKEKCENETRKRKDLISKVFPVSQTDFAMLYLMVERWKKAEMAKISRRYCGPSKIAELYLLLEKEIETLRNLEKLHAKVIKDLEVKRILDFFKEIGKPIEWYSSYKNIHITMDTLETQKGREYFQVYKLLSQKNLTVEERIKVYSEIREYLEKQHHCPLTDHIIKLMDRSCQILARGGFPWMNEGLEKRIEASVLQHFKMVECNEGVTGRMNKIKKNKMKNQVFCMRCQRLKPLEAYYFDARSGVKVCNRCKLIDKVEDPWIDILPHRYILKQIRNYERLHHSVSSIAFILQDKDIHHIITYIWHGHSALSECNDIYKLRMCRWRIMEDWSPWNCILLTLEEAKTHLRVEDLEEVYEEEFRNNVFNKHALARMQFPKLTEYDRHFWEATRDDKKMDEQSSFYIVDKPSCLFGEIPDKPDVKQVNEEDEDEGQDDNDDDDDDEE